MKDDPRISGQDDLEMILQLACLEEFKALDLLSKSVSHNLIGGLS